jgi:hypothetical protein
MRAVVPVAVLPWFVGAALLVGALWIGVHLWGPTDSIIMDVSRGQGRRAPAAITRTEYGRFGYLSTGSAIYIDREAILAGRPAVPERIETKRAIHWIGLLETIGVSVLVIVAVIVLPLWVRRLSAPIAQLTKVPPNNRWRGP